MTRVYYKEAVGAFIVFDVTRTSTFESVAKWKQDLDAKVQLPDGSPIPCVLLANKVSFNQSTSRPLCNLFHFLSSSFFFLLSSFFPSFLSSTSFAHFQSLFILILFFFYRCQFLFLSCLLLLLFSCKRFSSADLIVEVTRMCYFLLKQCDQPKEGIVATPGKLDEYCKEKGFAGWFETSAKDNINIDDAAKFLVGTVRYFPIPFFFFFFIFNLSYSTSVCHQGQLKPWCPNYLLVGACNLIAIINVLIWDYLRSSYPFSCS